MGGLVPVPPLLLPLILRGVVVLHACTLTQWPRLHGSGSPWTLWSISSSPPFISRLVATSCCRNSLNAFHPLWFSGADLHLCQ